MNTQVSIYQGLLIDSMTKKQEERCSECGAKKGHFMGCTELNTSPYGVDQ